MAGETVIFQPVLHPLLLALLCAPVAFVAVRSLLRARGARERTSWALRIAALLACAVLALRPGIPGGETQTLTTDTDVVILVDSTASIVAEDWGDGAPRLDGVRSDVDAIVAAYPGARFALLTFDASAEMRLPLTTDTAALHSALEVLTPEVTQRSQGSSIGIANRLLAQTLQAAAESSPERSRMVFYLGDGEQTAASEPESFESSAALLDGGAVLGYGTPEGGRMKVQTGEVGGASDEYILDGSEAALSKIDEAALQTIAADLGVEYQHRTADSQPELPEAPTSTTTRAAGTTGDVTELGWMLALLIVALLAADAALVATAIPGVLQLMRPRPSGQGGEA
ncbi:VWA domain-containing protein [Microbacterium paludicola]|uniref:VWA domain-containing protein n=1 Tax=Microbacterium paludicola TaxID=300019 RepID=UPI001F4766BF|nr:VWA domain-containing protein [Microbacterium paludicola]